MIAVKCIVTISEHGYELDSKDMADIIRTQGISSSTGTFSRMPKEFLLDMVDSSCAKAFQEATEKLNVIKGDDDAE